MLQALQHHEGALAHPAQPVAGQVHLLHVALGEVLEGQRVDRGKLVLAQVNLSQVSQGWELVGLQSGEGENFIIYFEIYRFFGY